MIKLKPLTEWSKNDPIPEILRIHNRLAIFLFGPPGTGKTTFINNYILTRNNSFKIINPDDISQTFTKDPTGKQWHSTSSDLAVTLIKNVTKSGHNFIYDVTGNSFDRISEATKAARENHYTVVFIHMLGELHKTVSQNLKRNRNVPHDFLMASYTKSQSLISRFSKELRPDAYYIILNLEGGYKFLKYENGQLLRHKVDKYVKTEIKHD